MTTILICGGDSWKNRGDAAILAGTVAGLRERLPGARLLVASDRPARTLAQEDVEVVSRRRPDHLVAALRQADLMLWGGGQLLQNASSKPFLVAQLALVQTAHLLGTPVMGFAQGVGPVQGAVSREAARRVVQGVQVFTVRDAPSAAALRGLSVGRLPVQVTADPALLLTPSPPARAASLLARTGVQRPFVAFALRRWGHYAGGWLPVGVMARRGAWPAQHERWFDGVLTDLARAADFVVERWGAEVLFVPMCPGGDQQDDLVAAAVRSRMAHAADAHLLNVDLSPSDLAAVLGAAEAVVGIRMHPLILAALSGVPGIALSYQGKGAAFLERLGLGRYALPIEEFRAADLIARLESLWRERAALRETVAAQVRVLREQAGRNVDLVAEVLGARAASGAFASGMRERWPDRERSAMRWPDEPPCPTTAGEDRVPPDPGEGGGGRSPSPAALDFDQFAARWTRLYQSRAVAGVPTFRTLLGGALRERRRRCLRLADLRPGDLVLDLGCGGGDFLGLVHGRQAIGIGLDRAEAMLRAARRRAPVGLLVRADAAHVPLRSESVGRVIAAGLADYLSPADLMATLLEARRVLRPDGILVLTLNRAHPFQRLRSRLPARWRGFGPRYEHEDRILRLVREAGLRVTHQESFAAPPFGVVTLIFQARRSR
ncbi:MAG: polysaccharide pyruvyl transferase family protein [Chloroflexi bacterium]|nr:polysaccharide pyruvyl transferase family protein [Chloroflexota bacterium]